MKSPSIKTIMNYLNVNLDEAKLIKVIWDIHPNNKDLFAIFECYGHNHYSTNSSISINERKLMVMNNILDAHGIESIVSENKYVNNYWHYIQALYINMGDSYINTIVFLTMENKIILSCFANIVESLEKKGYKFS
jgi:hypothetical protein